MPAMKLALKPAEFFLLGCGGFVFLVILAGIAGKSAWVVAPLFLLFCNSLYFPAAPLETQKRSAKLLWIVRAGLRDGFYYLLIPACVLSLCSASFHYEAFPFVTVVLRGIAIFLLGAPIVFILREKERRKIRLAGYFAVLAFVALAIPRYTILSGEFVGRSAAQAWMEQGRDARVPTLPDLRFTVVNPEEAIVASSRPPALIFLSARPEQPRCVGRPQSAEAACQKEIERMTRAIRPAR
jgi:hypothetical protein